LIKTPVGVRSDRTEPMKLHTYFLGNDSRIMTLRQRRHELVVTRNDWFIASTFVCWRKRETVYAVNTFSVRFWIFSEGLCVCTSQMPLITNQLTNQSINSPTKQPAYRPTDRPTNPPTNQRRNQPTNQLTDRPNFRPTDQPTNQPTNQRND